MKTQNGEPVIDLIDRDGNVHACLFSRVSWACAEFGYTLKDEKDYARAMKLISGLAEPGEKVKPAAVEEKGKAKPGATAKPGTARGDRTAPSDEDEPESLDVASVPVG